MTSSSSNVKFGTLARPSKSAMEFIEKQDRRMRFNTAPDPIYYVFDCIENRPIADLAKDFVKDTIFEFKSVVKNIMK